jgi:hypothetical protein
VPPNNYDSIDANTLNPKEEHLTMSEVSSLGDILRKRINHREEAAKLKLEMIERNMEYHKLASHCARSFINERMNEIWNPKPKVL